MPKFGREIIATIVVLFLIAMMAMVAASAVRKPVETGPLQAKLNEISQLDVTFTALSPVDLYGKDQVQAIALCPGATVDEIEQQLPLTGEELGLDSGLIPQDTNFLVSFDADNHATIERISREKIDLCPAGQQPGFDARGAIPLAKVAEGSWALPVGQG